MLTRTVSVGVPTRGYTGDAVYSNDSTLRKDLIKAGLGYVLAVAEGSPHHD